MKQRTDVYVMLGPPNSGKGTQAARMAEKLGLHHLSSGSAFREAVRSDSELGRLAGGYLEAGNLVPDDVAIDVILERLQELAGDGNGTILDGFPRTLEQAEALNERIGEIGLKMRAVISIEVNEDELLRRAAIRGRGDDLPDVVRKRFDVYRQTTLPLIEYYEQRGLLVPVDGDRPMDAVTTAILDSIGALIT